MTKVTHLALFCAVVVIGMLISPAVAVETAQGEDLYSSFNGAQERPDIDGNMIVWEDDRNGNKDIYFGTVDKFRADPYRGTQYPSYTGERITDNSTSQEKPSISGDYIVWQDDRHGNWDIYLYQRSTGEETRLTTDTGKQWLPAVCGNYVAWYDGSTDGANIVLYDIAAGTVKATIDANARMTIPFSDTPTEFKPALSERYVAWVNASDGERIWYYDIEAGTSGPVSTSTVVQSWPSLYGSLIAWEDHRHANPEVYVTDLDNPSGGERRITFDTSEQVSPAISGSIIVWEDNRDKGPDKTPGRGIYLYDLKSEKERSVRLPDNNSDEHLYPAVSGNTIIWQRGRSDDSNLYIFIYEPGAPVEPVLNSIEVAPTEITLKVGGTEQFTATLRDQFGNEIEGIPIDWTSSNETVGTIVKETGLFTAHAPGTTNVTASAGGKSTEATVTVTAPASVDPVLKRIELDPTTATLVINETKAFKATALDQDDNPMTGVDINWTSSNETVGIVDTTGLFTAHALGTTTVSAFNGNISANASVTVTAATPVDPVLSEIKVTPPRATLEVGDDQRFMATAFDQNHNVISAGKVVWTSSNATVGTIDESSGLFTAHAPGTTNVTASAGGKSTEATVTVNAAGPAFGMIAVSPSAATLDTDDTLQFDAIAFDRFGNIVPDAEVTWESSDEAVGTIDADGLFTAVCGGTTIVTATGGGVSGTATVTVSSDEPVVTSIVITPAAITLAEGGDATFTATAYGQNGREMSDVVIDWNCSDECVGTIDLCSGSFDALDVGTATITATAGGVTATADVEVTDDCSGVVISPSMIILEPENKWQLRATVYDLQDNAAAPAVTWSCDEGGAGMITPDGLFTAECEGTATITATAGSETGTAIVTVRSATPPDLARIVVSPSDVTVAAGNNLTPTATVFDLCGEILDAEVTWTSSDENKGTIDEATGFFTALAEGEVTLTASAEGLTGSACVTVGPSLPVPTCIEVEPTTATFASGETREFVATVFDQCDNTMDWVRVAWSCSNSSVGSIDRAGLFAAFAEGAADVKARAGSIEGAAAVTITAGPVPDPTPTPTPTPGGNDGPTHYDWGDGGGATGPTFSAGVRENLMSGETFTFSDIAVTSVRSVAVTAADAIPRLMLTVREATLPSSVASPPTGDTYEYVDISLYWANPGEISNATVTFTVTADWLEDHGMIPEDVRLMRYVNGGWQILETEVIGEEGGLYRFRATTPGFSTFAIAAAPENITTTGETNSALGEETNVTAGVTGTPEETGNLITTEATTVSATTTPATPLVYAPILAPLAFLLWRRKSH